jgi:hypothetical protein
MASHRKPATRARRSETAALASARLAPHRTSLVTGPAPTAVATLERPRVDARSGWGSVAKGRSAATVRVPGLTSDSLVLVTLQSVLARVHVLAAVPADGDFTVHFSKKASRESKFAWHVLD